MQKEIVLALVTFLHDLFTVAWIGGLFSLALVVVPSLQYAFGKGPEMKKVMGLIQTRLSKYIYISMAGLILTGFLKARNSAAFSGLFNFGSTYAIMLSLKHIVVIAMVVIALLRSLVFNSNKPDLTQKQQKISGMLLMLNLGLGVLVLLLSGFIVAFGGV